MAPQPPANFQNSASDEAYLNDLLIAWENKSKAVVNFRCKFVCHKYNIYGPAPDYKFSEDSGELSYRSPDRGSFKIESSNVWTPEARTADDTGPIKGTYTEQENAKTHWVCDGKSVFEFDYSQKQLKERPIPPEMQGQRIVDGPLPFLFGAEANKLKARYWFRICKEPTLTTDTQLCIQALPKFQSDAANYKTVLVVFDMKHEYLMPKGIIVYHADNSRDSYSFDLASAQINRQFGQLFEALFSAPRTPFGWTKIMAEQSSDPTRQASEQGEGPR